MADGEVLDRAKFHSMMECTREDWEAIGRAAATSRGGSRYGPCAFAF